jgi:hypothetical protein
MTIRASTVHVATLRTRVKSECSRQPDIPTRSQHARQMGDHAEERGLTLWQSEYAADSEKTGRLHYWDLCQRRIRVGRREPDIGPG